MSLTTIEINEAQSILTNQGAAAFYNYLDSKGESYGRLGLEVTNNSGWQGALANGFAESGGKDHQVEIAHGSTNWNALNEALAQAHLDAYTANLGDPPTWIQIRDYHNARYEDAGLNENDWFPNKMLNESGDPGALWADWQDNTGSFDLAEDAWDVASAGAALAIPPYYVAQGLNPSDPGFIEQVDFARHFYDALANMDDAHRTQMASDLVSDIPVLGDLIPLLNDLAQIPSSYGWAWNNPGEVLKEALAPWLQGVLDKIGDAANVSTPLVLDLDGDGIELTTLNGTGSVYWDIDLDGFGEASAWVSGGDGLLAIDVNADGIINDHSELFGDQTGSPNGFAALAVYDSNLDDQITSADTQFGDLLIWVDANSNGYSEATELHTLTDLGITSIDLNFSNVSYAIAGNEIKQESTFTINGQTRTIVDAWFAFDDANTVYTEDYTLDIRTLFLPTLRGFGTIPDLHIAMSQDETLLDMVAEISKADADTLFSSAFDLPAKIEAILYRWAGVDGIDTSSRGAYMSDARLLEFLEELSGSEWSTSTSSSDPTGPGQTDVLLEAFHAATTNFMMQLLVQTDARSLFSEDAVYNLASGEIDNNVYDVNAFDFLDGSNINNAGNTFDNAYLYADDSGDASVYDGGGDDVLLLSGVEFQDVRLIRNNTHLEIYTNNDKIVINHQFHDEVYGGLGDNRIERAMISDGSHIDLVDNIVFTGTAGNESLQGTSKDNTLYGLGGNDYLSSYDGNDVLVGGIGNDTIYGGQGNDTYIWAIGDGDDLIIEEGGTDKISFAEGITADDVRLVRSGLDLYLHVGSEKIRIFQQFYTESYGTGEQYRVEEAVFGDETSLDLINNLTFTGTASGETVSGTNSSNTLIGLGGNDYLFGYGGGDVLVGGTGNDTVYGGQGNDTYVWAIGDGDDLIIEEGGTDKISFAEGITADDVRLVRSGLDLYLHVGSEKIRIFQQFYTESYGTGEQYRVEEAVFSDETSLDLINNLTFTGTASGETVNGTNGSNTLIGLGGNDYLYGYDGDDVLYGGTGTDTLSGGAGADIFAWKATDIDGSLDTVSDFSQAAGDQIDISDILDVAGYDPMTDLLSDFLQITEGSSSTTLWVDATGTGTFDASTDFAVLSSVTDILAGGNGSVSTETDLQNLVSNGTLLAA